MYKLTKVRKVRFRQTDRQTDRQVQILTKVKERDRQTDAQTYMYQGEEGKRQTTRSETDRQTARYTNLPRGGG